MCKTTAETDAPFLRNFLGALDFAVPGKIGGVDEAINPFFNLDEGTVRGQVANPRLDDGADGQPLFQSFPGVGLKTLHADGNTALGVLHIEDDHFDRIADFVEIGGMPATPRPSEFRNVDQALDTCLQFNKNTVVT